MSTLAKESLKQAYLETLKYSSLLKEHKGPQEEPWDYINYSILVSNCLKILETLIARSLPVKLLEEAYRIQTNPLFYFKKEVVQYSHTTRHYASQLVEIFEKTCLEPSLENANILSTRWSQLAFQINSDYQETKNYLSN